MQYIIVGIAPLNPLGPRQFLWTSVFFSASFMLWAISNTWIANFKILLFNLTPKGLGLPYVGFCDSGQVAVNAFYF
jgi:hypothetical protein